MKRRWLPGSSEHNVRKISTNSTAKRNRLIAQREAIVQGHLLKESVKESKKAESTAGETPSPVKPKRQRANAKAGPSSTPLKRKGPEPVKEELPEPDEIYLKKLRLDDEDDLDGKYFPT
jgi:hypothetical protein